VRQRKNAIDTLIKVGSRRELRERADGWSANLSLPDAQTLTRHLDTLEETDHIFRLGIIHTYTSALLDPWLDLHAAAQGITLQTYHAPYGMSLMESQTGSGLSAHTPDLTLFLLTREDLHPELVTPISAFDQEQRSRIRDEAVMRLIEILRRFRANIPGRMAVTILPRILSSGLGLYDGQAEHSEDAWWASLKQSIAASLDNELDSAMLLDLDRILLELGRRAFFDPRFWYSSRFPFTPQAANELARHILSLAVVAKSPKAKVIVLDADNTLWGGIVGEDGIEGIALGPEYPGNAFVDFQRRILDYQQRGFILAICSKNNPQDVHEVLESHPHQVLRSRHFAAQRINWLPKHENLTSLAAELNLGLDSFIFVDDSDHECAIVRRQLPQVEVIQTPSKTVEIPFCLEKVSRLEILSLTQEDLQKTHLYAQEVQRRQLQTDVGRQGGDIGDYLKSLDMTMSISLDSARHVGRLTQLTQKTNQFNLTTRRYNEQQMREFIESDDWTVGSFSLADIFGDSGIVGLMLLRHLNASTAEIDTFLMSCRVIGRRAETAFLETVLARQASSGVSRIIADYLPTRKNQLVANFLAEHGFTLGEDGRYSRDLLAPPSSMDTLPPITINMTDR